MRGLVKRIAKSEEESICFLSELTLLPSSSRSICVSSMKSSLVRNNRKVIGRIKVLKHEGIGLVIFPRPEASLEEAARFHIAIERRRLQQRYAPNSHYRS